MTNDPSLPRHDDISAESLLGQVADEFVERLDRGERVGIEEYAERYPQIASEIRQVLPALAVMQPAEENAEPICDGSAQETQVPGTLGDFRIIREIGRGGMGIVYEAEQVSIGRRVAIKVLPFAAMLDPKQLQRFKNEVHATGQLHHTNIVPVYSVGCERGVHFYAMQYIDGQTLADVIGELRRSAGLEPPTESVGNGLRAVPNAPSDAGPDSSARRRNATESVPYSAPELTTQAALALSTEHSTKNPAYFRNVAQLGIQAAQALDHAHQLGVVHRDIKPSNLLLDVRANLWITDFGLARFDTDASLTMTGDLVGTLRYMSPEQAMANRGLVDHRTDIYSLGVTLYEILTLQPAFTGSDRREVLNRIASEEPINPRRMNPAIPADLETILLKAIAKEPERRYSTARDLAADLGRFLENQPIRAKRPTILDWVRKWGRRHKPLVFAAVIGSVTATIGLTISTILITRERAEAIRQRDEAFRQQAMVVEREASLRRYVYATDMKLAWAAWNNADLQQVRQLLSRHQPDSDQEDMRSFAWYYLNGLSSQTAPLTLTGHDAEVYHVAVSPDGKIIASASKDRTAKLWDLATGQLRSTLKGHDGEVNCIAFSPDGKTLATASDDRTVRFWNSLTGQEQSTKVLTGFSMPVHRVEFSSDGKILVTAELSERWDAAAATVWDLSSGQQRVRLEGHFLLAFSPDTETLATTSWDNAVRLWNVAGGQERAVLRGHAAAVVTGMFSPDGQTLATGSIDISIRLWDVVNSVERATFHGHASAVRSVAFSPDGKLLASADYNGAVRLWELKSGGQQAIFAGDSARVWCVRFTPDGGALATGGFDRTVKLWELNVAHGQTRLPDQFAPVTSMNFSPDSKVLATSNAAHESILWNVRTGDAETVTRHDSPRNLLRVAFSQDLRCLATATSDSTIHVVDPATGIERIAFECPVPIACLMFSPEDRMLVGELHDESVRVWDSKTGRELHLLKQASHRLDSQSIGFSPDGGTLAVQSADSVRRWDLATGLFSDLRTSHKGWVSCVAYSPDGKTLATGGNDRQIKLWDTQTDQERVNLGGHRGALYFLAFSPDGKTLASAGGNEVKLWDLATTQELFSLVGHTGTVYCVAFSPDGRTLATAGASADGQRGEVNFWRAATTTQDMNTSNR